MEQVNFSAKITKRIFTGRMFFQISGGSYMKSDFRINRSISFFLLTMLKNFFIDNQHVKKNML